MALIYLLCMNVYTNAIKKKFKNKWSDFNIRYKSILFKKKKKSTVVYSNCTISSANFQHVRYSIPYIIYNPLSVNCNRKKKHASHVIIASNMTLFIFIINHSYKIGILQFLYFLYKKSSVNYWDEESGQEGAKQNSFEQK